MFFAGSLSDVIRKVEAATVSRPKGLGQPRSASIQQVVLDCTVAFDCGWMVLGMSTVTYVYLEGPEAEAGCFNP
jgi:hypothetical protein